MNLPPHPGTHSPVCSCLLGSHKAPLPCEKRRESFEERKKRTFPLSRLEPSAHAFSVKSHDNSTANSSGLKRRKVSARPRLDFHIMPLGLAASSWRPPPSRACVPEPCSSFVALRLDPTPFPLVFVPSEPHRFVALWLLTLLPSFAWRRLSRPSLALPCVAECILQLHLTQGCRLVPNQLHQCL